VPVALGFFGKKKATDDDGKTTAGAGGTTAEESGKFEPDPGKARRFFEHARTVHDSTNYEYATTLWLQGLRFDPTSMPALESFYRSGQAYAEANPKAKGPSKDQAKNFDGKSAIDRYLRALLEWGTRAADWQSGLKALEAAVKLELTEPAHWIGTRTLASAMEEGKAKKEHYVAMMQLFAKIGAFDRAVQAGEAAYRLDPTDAKLQAENRNMSAQATMTKGGYEATGQAGGFRQNVRDMEAQRARIEEESVVKSAGAADRVVLRNKEEYETRPNDPSTISKYAKSLLERGTPEDEALAYKILTKGYESTQVYRLKQAAGDIRLRVMRRKLVQLRDAAEAAPGDEARKSAYESGLRQYRDAELKEYAERVDHYPTDLQLKYELGKRYQELGQHDKAIEQFQVAQHAPGIANTVANLLGQSFLAMGWLDESADTFRRALSEHEFQGDELGLNLRYNLMTTLTRQAEEHRSLEAAEEAFKLASGIAIQQIGYRDIRERREKLQALVKELRTGAG